MNEIDKRKPSMDPMGDSKAIDELLAPKFAAKYSAKEIESRIFPKLPRPVWLCDYKEYRSWMTQQILTKQRKMPFYFQVVLSEMIIILILIILIWCACGLQPMLYKHLFNYKTEEFLLQDLETIPIYRENILTWDKAMKIVHKVLERSDWYGNFLYKKTVTGGLGDKYEKTNLIISPPQIRLLAVKECDSKRKEVIHTGMAQVAGGGDFDCHPEYSENEHLDNNENKNDKKCQNFSMGYSPDFVGEFSTYDCKSSMKYSSETIESFLTYNDFFKHLDDNHVLNEATRAMFFEFAIYCLDLDTFAYIRFVVEQTTSEDKFFTSDVYNMSFMNQILIRDCFYLGLNILIFMFAVYLVIEEIRELYSLRCYYFFMISTYVDWIIVTFIFLAMFYYIRVITSVSYHKRIVNRINETLVTHNDYVFFDIIDDKYKHQHFLLIALVFLVIRFLRYLHVFIMFQAYIAVQRQLVACIALLFCFGIGLACMGHLYFGKMLGYYSNFFTTICSTIGFSAVFRDYHLLEEANRLKTPIFIFFMAISRILFVLLVIPLSYKLTAYINRLTILRGRTAERVACAPCFRIYYLSKTTEDEEKALLQVLQRKLIKRGFGFNKLETEVFLKKYILKIDSRLDLHEFLRERDAEGNPSYNNLIIRAIEEGEFVRTKTNVKKSKVVKKKDKKEVAPKAETITKKDWRIVKHKINASEILLEICIERMVRLEDRLFQCQRLFGNPHIYDRKRIYGFD